MRFPATAELCPARRLLFMLLALVACALTPAAAQEQAAPAATAPPPAPPSVQPGEAETKANADPAAAGGPSEAAASAAPSADSPATTPAADAVKTSPPAADAPAPATDASAPAPTDAPSIGLQPEPASAPPSSAAKGKDLPHNLSPWGMFLAADSIVKAVMIGLALASFLTWTVWLAKAFELVTAKQRLRRAYAKIASVITLADAVEAVARMRGTGPHLVRQAAEELAASQAVLNHGDNAGVKERVTSRLARVEAAAGRRLTLGTGVLATIGATAPFVGLFGTVWGIMNAFIGISQAQTTNLAVVAPGIAEALLATAFGLVAAIPAVIIYNAFARSIAGYRLQLADVSAVIERLVSRDLDFHRLSERAVLMRAAE